MAQPDYVPIKRADRVRPTEALPVPRSWRPQRPGDLADAEMPKGHRFGNPTPDGGYGLKLARLFEPKLIRTEGEELLDVIEGCFAVGERRASIMGRAPVIYDMEFAFALWGYLGNAPPDLVSFRKSLFMGAAHEYWDEREVVDRVRDEVYYLSPAEVSDRLASWRELINAN